MTKNILTNLIVAAFAASNLTACQKELDGTIPKKEPIAAAQNKQQKQYPPYGPPLYVGVDEIDISRQPGNNYLKTTPPVEDRATTIPFGGTPMKNGKVLAKIFISQPPQQFTLTPTGFTATYLPGMQNEFIARDSSDFSWLIQANNSKPGGYDTLGVNTIEMFANVETISGTGKKPPRVGDTLTGFVQLNENAVLTNYVQGDSTTRLVFKNPSVK